MQNGDFLLEATASFKIWIDEVKAGVKADFDWYPYSTISNFLALRELFNLHPLDSLCPSKHVADIGAADGDLAIFIARLGYSVDVIDNAPTNYNGLRGLRALVQNSGFLDKVHVTEIDVDDQFVLSRPRYDLVFLLGILYHLKNPYYILERLSRQTRHMIVSTRIMRFAPDGRDMTGLPVAYLLGPTESNGDATNYWIFTKQALVRLVERAGWNVTYLTTLGDTKTSNPSAQDRDERAFLLLTSRYS